MSAYRHHYDIIVSENASFCKTLKALLNEFKIYLKRFIVAMLANFLNSTNVFKEKCCLPVIPDNVIQVSSYTSH